MPQHDHEHGANQTSERITDITQIVKDVPLRFGYEVQVEDADGYKWQACGPTVKGVVCSVQNGTEGRRSFQFMPDVALDEGEYATRHPFTVPVDRLEPFVYTSPKGEGTFRAVLTKTI